jgi:hypothetical protein
MFLNLLSESEFRSNGMFIAKMLQIIKLRRSSTHAAPPELIKYGITFLYKHSVPPELCI